MAQPVRLRPQDSAGAVSDPPFQVSEELVNDVLRVDGKYVIVGATRCTSTDLEGNVPWDLNGLVRGHPAARASRGRRRRIGNERVR